jgi:hypothetical protein
MALIEGQAPPRTDDPTPVTAPARAGRVIAMLTFTAVATIWWLGVGVPPDLISMFVWLWLACIAWRWGVPARRHLDFVRDWWPAFATLLFYTYTRGFADGLGIAPHERMPVVVDTWLGFGELPTHRLQSLLCGSTCDDMDAGRWYDTLFTATYVTHFVCGLTLAVVLWLSNRALWSAWMRRYLALNLAGLSVYVVYPMVPPWMASEHGAFEPSISRMTGRGGHGPGLELSRVIMGPVGNEVAAMPSLHAGTACLVAFFAITTMRSRLRWLLLLYPLTMTTALVYFGEHYLIDAIAGGALAGVVMTACTAWERRRSSRAGLGAVGARTGHELDRVGPAAPPAGH